MFTAHSIPVRPTIALRHRTCTAARWPTRHGWSPPPPATRDYDQVWQSRSGPPQVPWLEPERRDHLSALAGRGLQAVIVCPVGFVADHIEVVWDLDQELRQQAAGAPGIAFARRCHPQWSTRFASSP